VRLVIAAILIAGQTSYADACAVGPYTFDLTAPGAVFTPKSLRGLRVFIGEVIAIEPANNASRGSHLVSFKVLTDYSNSDDGAHSVSVTAYANFGNHIGGCNQIVKLGQVGKFALSNDDGFSQMRPVLFRY